VLLRAGHRLDSITLRADAHHLLTDVWTSLGVVLGVALTKLAKASGCSGSDWLWCYAAGSAMAAGAIASVIGTPFDVALVRMQADGMRPAAERRGSKNVFDALGRIAREEGVARLWQGFEPTVFRAVAMNVGMMASFDQAKQAIARYIDGFYNPIRRHSALDYISPAQFERTASR
jgi:hypothetical protein